MFEAGKKAPIISVVGAGGKTTLINTMACILEKEKKQAIITTTTHMSKQVRWVNALNHSPEEIRQLLENNNIIVVGASYNENKIMAADKSILNEIVNWEIPILIEADGARHMACKVPRENEPVIISQTDIVIAVMGLDALHRPIEDGCFCPEQVAEFLHCSIKKSLTYKDMCTILMSHSGMKKGVTDAMKYCIVLNKADTKERREDGIKIKKMLGELGMVEVYVTSLKSLFHFLSH